MTSDSEWKARKSWMTEWLLPFPPIPSYQKKKKKKTKIYSIQLFDF